EGDEKKQNAFTRSELVIPSKSALLDRPDLMRQIDDKLKSKDGIQTVALVGIGGAGKTTLSRQYARHQKANIVWEINAETHESLERSFENLAQALSKTEEDKKTLRGLQEIKDPQEKEEKLIQFVKEHLKSHANWFLIYDNVEKFADVQKYFPQDVNIWGQGKIIITTRDSNIENNSYVCYALQIGQLSQNQKLHLFMKIMNHGKNRDWTQVQQEEANAFLKKIPPFPLDVSVAAYYLKATNGSYEQYVGYLGQHDKDFETIQENVLKETSDYTKTRYNIISLSLKQLIDIHKDFESLLLLMCLLDSQNIPKDLLSSYKTEVGADNFIYHLKKLSLITCENSFVKKSILTLSIHRSTQKISLQYLIRHLKLDKNSNLMKSISDTLEKYAAKVIEKEDYSQMKVLANHYKVLLEQDRLLTEVMKANVSAVLGELYFYLGNYIYAQHFLETATRTLNANNSKNYVRLAQILSHQGCIVRELGEYKKAQRLLEQSLKIYKEHFPENHRDIAENLVYLGLTNWNLGRYESAEELLKQSLALYKKYVPGNHGGIAWVYGCLGVVNWSLGNYKKSQELFNQSIILYKKYLPEHELGVARFSAWLGTLQLSFGNYKTALELLNQSTLILKNSFSQNYILNGWVLIMQGKLHKEMGDYKTALELLNQGSLVLKNDSSQNQILNGWILIIKGNVYKEMGNYESAKTLLEKSLFVYKKYYNDSHIETSQILRDLGHVYLLEGYISKAENLFIKSLKIFQDNQHPDAYKTLEYLAELSLKKSALLENKQNLQEAQNFKTQAINYLKQALEIVKTHFPANSPHIARIESKLKSLEQDVGRQDK
ncbi:MAG TPA: tetratricopeptide repeat protein, partial [Alphaproteobacteria bacterium]|nr:tetratricopeptide repeat protein [Alphaproteobacteria bacterium]